MKPAGQQPQVKSQPGFAYDAVNRLYVLFGSQFESDPRTWVYDLEKNAWRVLEVKEHPPAEKSCPVLAADTRNGIVLCNVEGKDGLETWALDVAKPAWTRLKLPQEPDMSGNRNRVLLYLPDENLFVLENRTKDEQQIWTFRYAEGQASVGQASRQALRTASSLSQGTGWKPVLRRATGWKPVLRWCSTYVCLCRRRNALSCNGRSRPAKWPAIMSSGADVAVYSMPQVLRIAKQYPQASEMAVGQIKGFGRFERLTKKPIADHAVRRYVDRSHGHAEGTRGHGPLRHRQPARPVRRQRQAVPFRRVRLSRDRRERQGRRERAVAVCVHVPDGRAARLLEGRGRRPDAA